MSTTVSIKRFRMKGGVERGRFFHLGAKGICRTRCGDLLSAPFFCAVTFGLMDLTPAHHAGTRHVQHLAARDNAQRLG